MCVPDVLLSGDEKAIQEWKYQASIERTKKMRPHLYNKVLSNKLDIDVNYLP